MHTSASSLGSVGQAVLHAPPSAASSLPVKAQPEVLPSSAAATSGAAAATESPTTPASFGSASTPVASSSLAPSRSAAARQLKTRSPRLTTALRDPEYVKANKYFRSDHVQANPYGQVYVSPPILLRHIMTAFLTGTLRSLMPRCSGSGPCKAQARGCACSCHPLAQSCRGQRHRPLNPPRPWLTQYYGRNRSHRKCTSHCPDTNSLLCLHCPAVQFRLEELRILLPIAFSNPILRAVGFLTALGVRKEAHEAQSFNSEVIPVVSL